MTYEEFINNEVLKVEKKKPLPKYPVGIEGLKSFLVFLGVAVIVSYAAYYCGGYEEVVYTIPLYIQPWISTLVRRRCNKVLLDVLLLFLCLSWLIYSPSLVVTLLSGVYMISVSVYQIVREMSEEEEKDAGLLTIIVNAVLMIGVGSFAIVQGRRGFEWFLGGQAVLFVVLFVYYQHYVAIEEAMKHLKFGPQQSFFSSVRLKAINNRSIWSFLGIFVIFTAFFYIVGLNDVVEELISEVVEYLDFENNFGFSLGAPGVSKMMSDLEQGELAKWDGSRFGKNFVFGEIIKLIIIVWSILAIGVLAAHLWIEERMRSRLERKKEQVDNEEEKIFLKKKSRAKRKFDFTRFINRSEESQIRREYYKRVKGELGKSIKQSHTPKQVGEKLSHIEALANQYSRIRYKEKALIGGNVHADCRNSGTHTED